MNNEKICNVHRLTEALQNAEGVEVFEALKYVPNANLKDMKDMIVYILKHRPKIKIPKLKLIKDK